MGRLFPRHRPRFVVRTGIQVGNKKIAACFDREKNTRFGVRFDTKQQTGGSDEEPPVFDHSMIRVCKISR